MNPNPSRRSFLQTTLAVAATPLFAPVIHAADKAGSKLPVVGKGEHTYECLHDWGMANLPSGAHYGNASHGVTVDESGLIYITHYGDPGSIFVFDEAGKFVKSLGNFHQLGSGKEKKTARGHGIDLRKEGSEEFLYLSASDSTLDFAKMNLKGEIVWRVGREKLHQDSGKYEKGAAYRPTNISFSPDGGYFLGDGYGSSLIHQYDKTISICEPLAVWAKRMGSFARRMGSGWTAATGCPSWSWQTGPTNGCNGSTWTANISKPWAVSCFPPILTFPAIGCWCPTCTAE